MGKEHDDTHARGAGRGGRLPNLGLLALVIAAGGLFTGVFLALNYAPTLDAAHASVRHLIDHVALGGFLRALHHWAGNFALVLAALHGWRLFWNGAYKAPRRGLWVLGGLIFLVLVGFAYTGYLLPGDERAYAGLNVMQGIAGSTPVAGEAASAVVRGGAEVSSATLTRVYVVHTMVLPAALVALVVLFVRTRRRIAASDAAGAEPAHDAGAWRAALRRDAIGAAAVLVLLGVVAWLAPPALGRKLTPGEIAPDARPEWFLLWVNLLLDRVRIEGATFLVGFLLPILLAVLGLGLPWLARGAARAPARRKPEIAAAGALLLALGALTVAAVASHEPSPTAGDASATAPDGAAPGADGHADGASGNGTPDAGASGKGDAEDGDVSDRARTLNAQVEPILEKFDCMRCHVIDDRPSAEESGPPLLRRGSDDRPPFHELYARTFFRLKVGDPRKFWDFTGMNYPRRSMKPTEEELDLLERWFYLDHER